MFNRGCLRLVPHIAPFLGYTSSLAVHFNVGSVFRSFSDTHNPCWLRTDFLTAGLVAFSHMRGGKDFLTTVVQREMEILDRIHAVDLHPFEIEAAMQTASSS